MKYQKKQNQAYRSRFHAEGAVSSETIQHQRQSGRISDKGQDELLLRF